MVTELMGCLMAPFFIASFDGCTDLPGLGGMFVKFLGLCSHSALLFHHTLTISTDTSKPAAWIVTY